MDCVNFVFRFIRDFSSSMRRSKQIDRTMSCPPPSDTVRPKLPAEWTTP